jgi:electron transfer flavoprotein alpha subunit
VVINNDPEAPFFKVADYGIVDAFDPKVNRNLKHLEHNHNVIFFNKYSCLKTR